MLFELPVELRSKIYARARYEAARDVVERLLTRRRPGGNPSMHLVEWRLSDTKRMALEHYTWGASTQHRVVVNVRDFARVYLGCSSGTRTSTNTRGRRTACSSSWRRSARRGTS
jgi:hypothetical protein